MYTAWRSARTPDPDLRRGGQTWTVDAKHPSAAEHTGRPPTGSGRRLSPTATVASGGRDKTLRCGHGNGKRAARPAGTAGVNAGGVRPDGKTFASAGDDFVVRYGTGLPGRSCRPDRRQPIAALLTPRTVGGWHGQRGRRRDAVAAAPGMIIPSAWRARGGRDTGDRSTPGLLPDGQRWPAGAPPERPAVAAATGRPCDSTACRPRP